MLLAFVVYKLCMSALQYKEETNQLSLTTVFHSQFEVEQIARLSVHEQCGHYIPNKACLLFTG